MPRKSTEARLAYAREYHRKNREKILRKMRAYHKKYYPTHRDEVREHQRKRADALRQRLDKIKDEPCLDCGGRFPPECMELDHVKGQKVANVGQMRLHCAEKIDAEIAKCELVCANCHRIRTARRVRERSINQEE